MMKEVILNLIEKESENTKLDFKAEQYPIEKGNNKKSEFLKDMCAFSNPPSKDDKFIIIGVEEKNGIAIGFKPIDELHDQASYQQFLNQYIEPEINFEYKKRLYTKEIIWLTSDSLTTIKDHIYSRKNIRIFNRKEISIESVQAL